MRISHSSRAVSKIYALGVAKPFRWNVSKREQLGRLVGGDVAESYPEFLSDLRACAARVLALSRDSDLVFIGRSPESLFDYLSGVLEDTSWRERLSLLNVSMRSTSKSTGSTVPESVTAGREHLFALGLDPNGLLTAPRPIALVDLVSTGATLGNVTTFLLDWVSEAGTDLPATRKKLRFVGITWRTKTSPNTFRWQQHADWLDTFPASVVKNVSIPGRLWHYLGNVQEKVEPTNPTWRWVDPEMQRPPRAREHLRALSLALHLYQHGLQDDERRRFAELLSKQATVREAWFRGLILEVTRGRK